MIILASVTLPTVHRLYRFHAARVGAMVRLCQAKTANPLPEASFGRYFSRCASVPYALMGCMTSEDYAHG